MQSAPPEILQTATTPGILRDNHPSTQDGFYSDRDTGSGGRSTGDLASETHSGAQTSDDVSVVSSTTSRSGRTYTRRLSRQDTSSEERSPGSRIDAYERAHFGSRRPSDGMLFQVIPSTNHKDAQVSLLDLPNGESVSRYIEQC